MRALICARPAGFPWLAIAGSLAMLLRPGNAGSSTFAGHLAVLTAAIRQIPAARGIPGVPGSHHAQFTDVLHRQHAVVEDQVRDGKSMRLHNLPSKTWAVNCGWMLAANLTANLAAWSRTLSLYDHDDLKDAQPDTLLLRLASAKMSAKPWLKRCA